MMQGRSAAALEAARAMAAGVPPEFIEAMGPFIDGLMPIELHVLVRFGRWQEVLHAPEFAPELVAANALRRYARGTALAALGRLDEAESEERELDAATLEIDAARTIGNNPARRVLAVASLMLAGEIAYRRGRIGDALAKLREAAAIEDELVYDEPPDWMMPVRHALGATLLQAGEVAEAERAYREDLRRFPENGWSLVGLAKCLEARGATDEARDVRQRFEKAWAGADVPLRSSCFCLPDA